MERSCNTSRLKGPTEGKELDLRGQKLTDGLTEDPVPALLPFRQEGILLEGTVRALFRLIREDASMDEPVLVLVGIRSMLAGMLVSDTLRGLAGVTLARMLVSDTL